MATIRKTNSVASQPVKAGETVPTDHTPHITFEQSMAAAAQKIDALLRGGVECITYICSAFLVGYLSRSADKPKLATMRDEFALALGKQGLGGTQTKKYLDYAFKMAGNMHKECQYGMEMAALIAATDPDMAHSAVKAWLGRHTHGKKTEHGFLLTDAAIRLNVLGIYLGFEDDPAKPETLPGTNTEEEKKKVENSRKAAGKRIAKDPAILQNVPTSALVDTVAKVVSFDVLIVKHIQNETKAAALREEMEKVIAAYKARIAELETSIGGKAGKKSKRTQSETVRKAA